MNLVIGIGIVIAAVLLFQRTSMGATLSGKLGASDIAKYAASAGFTGADLQTAVSVALAESSGNPAARGDLALGVSVGLWQINLKAHPEYNDVDLTDPQTNANAAYAIYSAADYSFRPWSTYKTSAYETYSDAALQGITDAGLNA